MAKSSHRINEGDKVRLLSRKSYVDCETIHIPPVAGVGTVRKISMITFKRMYRNHIKDVCQTYDDCITCALVAFDEPIKQYRNLIDLYGNRLLDEADLKEIVVPVSNLISDELVQRHEMLMPGDLIQYGIRKSKKAMVMSNAEKKIIQAGTPTRCKVSLLQDGVMKQLLIKPIVTEIIRDGEKIFSIECNGILK